MPDAASLVRPGAPSTFLMLLFASGNQYAF